MANCLPNDARDKLELQYILRFYSLRGWNVLLSSVKIVSTFAADTTAVNGIGLLTMAAERQDGGTTHQVKGVRGKGKGPWRFKRHQRMGRGVFEDNRVGWY
jgi:hypothetical protein